MNSKENMDNYFRKSFAAKCRKSGLIALTIFICIAIVVGIVINCGLNQYRQMIKDSSFIQFNRWYCPEEDWTLDLIHWLEDPPTISYDSKTYYVKIVVYRHLVYEIYLLSTPDDTMGADTFVVSGRCQLSGEKLIMKEDRNECSEGILHTYVFELIKE